MSSVDSEPGALDGLLLECLPFVLKAETRRGGDEVRLRSFNDEAFFRQGMSIPRRLGRMVEAASGGQLAVRAASSALADKGGIGALVGEVYFVRCSPEVPDDEPVTVPTDDMILFVINRYRKLLTVNARIQPLEAIEAELVRQATERDALREAERISGENARLRQEETSAELARMVERIEQLLEHSDSVEAAKRWRSMQSRLNVHHGVITLPDLLDLCHMLGTDLATLATPSSVLTE